MARVTDNYHILRRNGTYYYQRRVPDGVAAVIGKRVVKYSLKTTDKKIAKQRRAIADLEWDARFEAALTSRDDQQQHQPPSRRHDWGPAESEIEQLIRSYVSVRTRERLADRPSNEDERRQMIENVVTEIGILKNADDPRADQSVYLVGHKILGQIGFSDDNLPMSYSAFAELVRRALLEIDRHKLASLEDDHRATHFDQLFDPSRAPPVTFGQLAAQFLKLREEDASVNAVGQQNVDRLRAQVSLMREIVGDATPVSSRRDCRQFHRAIRPLYGPA